MGQPAACHHFVWFRKMLGLFAAVMFVLFSVAMPAAFAAPDTPTDATVVPSVDVRGGEAGPNTASNTLSQGMASTGSGVMEFVLIGGVLVSVAIAAVVFMRRRSHPAIN